MPRKYVMSARARERERTRRRIIAAAIDLHTEKGILGTSWRDIAERADVSVGTVYNHFSSLDELVPACGELLMDRLAPPSPGDAMAVIGDARTVRERLERAARELFAFYERGGAHLRLFPGERELPAVREWEAYQRATVAAFVREALRGRRVTAATVQLVSTFLDLATYEALRARGVPTRRAATEVARAASCVVGSRTGGRD